MKATETIRGFKKIEFEDSYGVTCSIQESSNSSDDYIWVGVEDANPQILASNIAEGGTGWVKYDIPKEVSLTTRMHLNREQVSELLPILINFSKTGKL